VSKKDTAKGKNTGFIETQCGKTDVKMTAPRRFPDRQTRQMPLLPKENTEKGGVEKKKSSWGPFEQTKREKEV